MNDTLAVILAGGKGTRLEPLTRDRAKPAVPFGGNYRIIDFVLSNCLNSGFRKMMVLTQYKATSLDRHINLGWQGFFCRELDEYIDNIPPQQRIDEQWYQGTADAVYQNIYEIEKQRPKYIIILAGDHIYKMNYRAMIDYHCRMEADLTIGALRVSPQDASQFGIMAVDENQQVVGFEEKPNHPKVIPGDPNHCLASMGIYVFSTRFLLEQLCADANNTSSIHDFGKNIIPSIINKDRVFAFQFRDENRKQDSYWRDVGTLDAYFEANMDLIAIDPLLNLYDSSWPIRTYQPNLPPPKFVFGSRQGGDQDRVGVALDSLVCAGTIISGGRVERSVIGPQVRVNSFAHVEDSILFEGVDIGRHCKIRRTIIDKGVRIPAGFEIGYDLEKDRQRGFTISDGGIVTIPKTDTIDSLLGNRGETLRFDGPVGTQSVPQPMGLERTRSPVSR